MSNQASEKHLLACFCPKGGTGKTTIATQLAVSGRVKKRNVCFYDLDPQQTASFYFSRIDEKYRPNTILTDFSERPPAEADFIILDCEPSMRFVPPPAFTIIAPTLASILDLHAYRKVLELEGTHQIIRVINQYSMVRKDDKAIKDSLDPCVVISANTGIKHAMANGKTIWNSNHPGGRRAKMQFTYLIKRIIAGSAETLTHDDIANILITGEK